MADLDPDIAAVLARLDAEGWLPLTRGGVEEARRRYRDLSANRGRPEDLPVADVAGDVVVGPDADVEVRRYTPLVDRGTTVVWLHGGGWVLGDLDTADAAARRVARALGAHVVSVHYRRAPEHPHPAALQDAHAALRWAAGWRPSDRLVVGGDSAGGGLAAGVALLARDWGPRLDAQLLYYPGLDPAMNRPSVRENAAGPFLTVEDMSWFWSCYLPDAASRRDPTVALLEPAADPDGFAGIAPAVVATAALDPLRDEGRAYAGALRDAGVAVRERHGEGLPHGYLGFAGVVDSAREQVESALDDLRSLLED